MARAILAQANIWILPPEVIEQYGDYTDWRNVVGTGPFMLTDYVEGVSMTRTRNPNYHDFDEKYPENRLPTWRGRRALQGHPRTSICCVRSARRYTISRAV